MLVHLEHLINLGMTYLDHVRYNLAIIIVMLLFYHTSEKTSNFNIFALLHQGHISLLRS